MRDGRPTCPATHRRRWRTRAPTRSWLRSAGSRSSTSRSPTGTWSTSRCRCPRPSRPTPTSSSRPTSTPMRSPSSRICWACRPSRAVPAQLHLRVPDGRVRGAGHALGRSRHRVRGLVEHRPHHPRQRARGAGVDADWRHAVGLEGPFQGTGSCWCVRWQHSSYQTTSNGTAGKGNPKSVPSAADLLIASRQRLLMRVVADRHGGALGRVRLRSGQRCLRHGRDLDRGRAARRPPDRHRDRHPVDRPWRGARQRRGGARCGRGPSRRKQAGLCHGRQPAGSVTYGVTVGSASAVPDRAVARRRRTRRRRSASRRPGPWPRRHSSAEAHSPNASIRSTAQLVQGLAGIVLGATDPNTSPAS